MQNWDDENRRRERRAWVYAGGIILLAVVLAIIATMSAHADPLPPGKPAGVRQANLRNTELNILVALPIMAVLAVAISSSAGSSTTSTGK